MLYTNKYILKCFLIERLVHLKCSSGALELRHAKLLIGARKGPRHYCTHHAQYGSPALRVVTATCPRSGQSNAYQIGCFR